MDAGIYRDYKGNPVQVLGVAEHEGNGERMVVYVSFNVTERGPRLRCCTEEWFTENVEVGTNLFTPRHEYVGEEIPR